MISIINSETVAMNYELEKYKTLNNAKANGVDRVEEGQIYKYQGIFIICPPWDHRDKG